MDGAIRKPVLLMVVLSRAGSFLAGLHSVAVHLPAQKTAQAPANPVQHSGNSGIRFHGGNNVITSILLLMVTRNT